MVRFQALIRRWQKSPALHLLTSLFTLGLSFGRGNAKVHVGDLWGRMMFLPRLPFPPGAHLTSTTLASEASRLVSAGSRLWPASPASLRPPSLGTEAPGSCISNTDAALPFLQETSLKKQHKWPLLPPAGSLHATSLKWK